MKLSKRFLTLFMSVAMVVTSLSVTPLVALGEEEKSTNVAKIESTGIEYETLNLALEDATDGDKIILIGNPVITAKTEINKNITITDDGQTRIIFCLNTETGESAGRGLQVMSGKTVNFEGTEPGKLSLCGSKETDSGVTENNASTVLFIYKGTANITNTTFDSCVANQNGSAIRLYDSNCYANLNNVEFNDCTAKKLGIVYTPSGANVSFGGKITLSDYYIVDGTALIDNTFSDDSTIGIHKTTVSAGDTVVTGAISSANCGCFSIVNYDSYSVNSQGKVVAPPASGVCELNGTGYDSLADAVEAANSMSTSGTYTITLKADVTVPDAISFKNQIIITDDGTPRKIYVYSQTSFSSVTGRGFSKSSSASKMVTFKGTALGNLTILGHNKNKSVYNLGPVLYGYSSSSTDYVLYHFENLVIKETKADISGPTIYNGTGCHIELNNVKITDCAGRQGAAILNYGDNSITDILGGVEITNNSTSYHTAYGAVQNINGGKINIKGDNYIWDNHLGTDPSTQCNILYNSYQGLNLAGNLTGKVGVHFVDAEKKGEIFATSNSPSYTAKAFTPDNATGLRARVTTGGVLWDTVSYTLKLGKATIGEDSYSFASPTVTLPADGAKVLSIKVNNGHFTANYNAMGISPSKIMYINEDYEYTVAEEAPGDDVNYKAITLVFSSNLTSDNVKNIIKAFKFYVAGEGTEQNVTAGLYDENPENSIYVAGGMYTLDKTPTTYFNATHTAKTLGRSLASIPDKETETMILGALGCNDDGAWMGLEIQGDAWYWTSGSLAGTRVSKNASSAEGYEGAYVNWTGTNPNTSYGRVASINKNGKWATSNASAEKGAYYQDSDNNTVSVATSMRPSKESKTVLTSMNLSFNGDISMYFYFSFDNTILANPSKYSVRVTVGEDNYQYQVTEKVSDMASLKDSEGNYGIKVDVPAKMMGARVYMSICNEAGSVIRSYGNFNGTAPEKNYNPLYYANYILDNSSDDNVDRYNSNYSRDVIAMVKAMLNYGAAAQVQFEYDVENLVNKGCEDTTEVMTELPSSAVIISPEGSTNFTRADLVAESQTLLQVTYEGPEVDAPSVAFDEIPTTNFTYEEGVVSIPVSAQNLKSKCTITIGEDTVSLNVNFVLDSILKDGAASANAKKTADRLYKFGAAANDYFAEFKQTTKVQEALLKSAYAYLDKKLYTQYDQNPLDNLGSGNQERRQYFLNSEDLTSLKEGYFDCSSFCYNVARSVFGNEAGRDMFLASRYRSYSNLRTLCFTGKDYYNSDAIAKTYWNELPDVDAYLNPDKYVQQWKDVVADAKKTMEPGDFFAYYGHNPRGGAAGSGGHVVMWTGTGFIHCSGSDYDTTNKNDKVEENGSVQYIDAEDFTYLYLLKHNAYRAVIIRATQVYGASDVTNYGKAKIQLGSLGIEATGQDTTLGNTFYDGMYTNPGDTVRYTIKLTNKQLTNNLAVNKVVNISCDLPDGFTASQATSGGKIDGQTVTWSNIQVKPGSTATQITVTGKVSATATPGDILKGIKGQVTLAEAGDNAYPLSFESQSVEIENKYDASVINGIKNLASTYTTYTKESSSIKTVNKILSSATGLSINIGNTNNDAFKGALGQVSEKSDDYRNITLDPWWDAYYVSNLVGGRKVANTSLQTGLNNGTSRARNLKPENLKIGDDIVTATGYSATDSLSSVTHYIYIGDNQMVKVTTNGVDATLQDADRTCKRAIGESFFVVLRPLK